MTQEQSFFARRRAGLKAEREAEVLPPVAEVVEVAPDLTDMSDADILDLLELPDPDTLRKGDNFAAFMAKAVPLHLRNRALRTLWRSDPVLACLDGLNDYDADYLTGSTGQGIIKTSYQVGKGLLAHVEKLAAEVAAQDDDAVTDGVACDDDLCDADNPATPADHDADTATVAFAADADDTDHPVSPPRRMRFTFGDPA